MYVGTETKAFENGLRAHVYLFGLRAKMVKCAADGKEGFVEIYKCDENGLLHANEKGELATCRLYGDVRIEII